jgi:hypothetical protein
VPDTAGNSKRLSPEERVTVFWLVVLLPLMSLCLWVFGLMRLYLWLGRLSALTGRTRGSRENQTGKAHRLGELVTWVNHGVSFYEAACLSESLVLWWLLRSRGIGADLRLGVRTILGPFESHAWVEYKGAVLNDFENVNQAYEAFDISTLAPEIKAS